MEVINNNKIFIARYIFSDVKVKLFFNPSEVSKINSLINSAVLIIFFIYMLHPCITYMYLSCNTLYRIFAKQFIFVNPSCSKVVLVLQTATSM